MDDQRILDLAIAYRAISAEMDQVPEGDDVAYERLCDRHGDIEQEMSTLIPTTKLGAVEQLDMLSDHDEASQRALGVLRGLIQAA